MGIQKIPIFFYKYINKILNMKICNFCGYDEGWVIQSPFNKNKYVVQCHVCGAIGPESNTQNGAEKKWDGILKEIDDEKQFNLILNEDLGGVSTPMSTTMNTSGMGNAQPAQIAAMTGQQQSSPLSKGSGDRWDNKTIPKKKKRKKKTNENFYPSLEEQNINPYDKIGVQMAKKMKVPINFKKAKNQSVKQKFVSK